MKTIGTLTNDGFKIELHDDLTATVTPPSKMLQSFLDDDIKEYIRDYSPADGYPGYSLLSQWHKQYKGDLKLSPVPESPEGTIF